MIKEFIVKTTLAQGLPSRIIPECDPTFSSDSPLPPCNECFLAQTGYNVMMVLVWFAFVIVIFMAIFGGFRMFITLGNPDQLNKAKKQITNAIIGLVIVLLSWTIINVIFTTFTKLGGSWWQLHQLECETTLQDCQIKCEERYASSTDVLECQNQCPTAR
ncbi:MAG: hypothetical protein COT89_01960 [Candidatus Colwellbacteria bacterium CG10_big_fil_rev_8_21_14_0_10_42_22]|uniref:Uncharacterized protein n=1 Tax=Candidatus Colwellbacteria bacterium CG10_big_fil_rev_8_21_14_0_10_42_22 TaxID=1974540 RepID=A0A2H0VFU9_9BACT|nr:MAG: hypothetical protein COT89_01960 [Candidatus Colwellbacteria bacterium CG10_big_fil_rev_8_21_14_0_10_42_22]